MGNRAKLLFRGLFFWAAVVAVFVGVHWLLPDPPPHGHTADWYVGLAILLLVWKARQWALEVKQLLVGVQLGLLSVRRELEWHRMCSDRNHYQTEGGQREVASLLLSIRRELEWQRMYAWKRSQ